MDATLADRRVPVIPGEAARLRALHRYEILDSEYEPQFDAIVAVASELCGSPIAAISLVGSDRQWFKAVRGLPDDLRETPREVAFCAHAILQDGLLEVEDATKDERFRDNPLVTGVPNIRHYAGVPLIDRDRHHLGTICVIDPQPRTLTAAQRVALGQLGIVAMALIENRGRELGQARASAESEIELEKARHILARAARPRLGASDGIHHAIRPADRFSGDLIGAKRAPDDTLYLMLVDVMGHGLSSALFLLPLLENFELLVDRGVPVSDLVADVNHRLRTILPAGHFVAACVARIDRAGSSVEVWNGGLPDAWCLAPDGTVRRRLPSRHLALGLLPESGFDGTTECHRWEDGDALVIYSDGLTEAEDPEGNPFGEARLAEALSKSGDSAARVEAVLSALDRFSPRAAYADDVSLIIADTASADRR